MAAKQINHLNELNTPHRVFNAPNDDVYHNLELPKHLLKHDEP